MYPDYDLLGRDKQESKYGSMINTLKQLEAKNVIRKFRSPLRYSLINSKSSVRYVKYIIEYRFNIEMPEELIY